MSYFLIAVFFLVFCIGAWLVFATTSSLTQARKPNVVVIDCRSQSEWDSGHVNIGEVLHIPLGELKDSKKLPKDKARPIMIHCAAGARSARGKIILESLGYTDVANTVNVKVTEAALEAAETFNLTEEDLKMD